MDQARPGIVRLALGKLCWLIAFIDWLLYNVGDGQSMDDPWSVTPSGIQKLKYEKGSFVFCMQI